MRASWRGAIDLAGFPVNVGLYNRVKSRSSESFKTLGSDDKPIKQVLVESGEFKKLEADPHAKVATIGRNDTKKGVPVGKDEYKALPPEAVEAIGKRERSTSVEPRTFVPVSTVPLEIATTAFAVIPDEKVPGSEKPVNLIWNGLRESGLAYTTEITMRAGSRDSILVLYAREDGLYAVALPFAEELNLLPGFEFTADDKAAEMFGTFVETQYEVEERFEHGAFTSTYRAKRDEAINLALAGETIPVTEAPTAKDDGPDLMAIMAAAVEDKPKKKAAKPKAKKAPAKKAKVGA